ncbi:MAG: hypothetical protein HY922_09465 [Elusimicrobia bacterium]|nr:hypothetical protein [Elusimicrobiota bacterium]
MRVGADLGGSWLRAAVCKGRGFQRARRRIAAGEAPERALAQALRSLGLRRVRRLVIGARGAWLGSEKAALRRRLAGLADEILVISDLELAHLAAFSGGPGVLVAAGTGSAAYARDIRGRSARAGGLGPLLGDEGSSFWIGRRWLCALPDEEIRRFAKRPDAVRAVAALARVVLARAANDRRARAIVREACQGLATLASRAASQLTFKGPAPLSWSGGLFRSALFRAEFLRRLPRRKFSPRPMERRPEDAAAISGAPNIGNAYRTFQTT